MRKKVISAIMITLLAFVFCACGSASEATPSDVAGDFLEAVKAQDTTAIEKVYAGEGFDMTKSTDTSDLPEGLAEQLTEKMFGFDYEIGEEAIDGESATVEVTIKTYDIGDAFEDFMGEYVSQALDLAMSGADEEKLTEVAMEIFAEKFDELSDKDYSATVKLPLEKTEDGWKVSQIDDDSDFLNALTGGMLDAVKKISESFE